MAGNETHTIMKKSLAKALMEAGVQHFSIGGDVQNFISGVTPQDTYQASLAPQQYSQYSPAIAQSYQAANAGNQTAAGIQAQQQSLANTLLAQSQGGGPNPAAAALNQATGANVANQAALMAGQRGAAGNVGLMARQAAQQGAGVQQNAVGQAATMQAQQQLAAQQALMQQQQAMAGGNVAEQGVNAQLYGTGAGAQNAQNTAQIQNAGMAQGINASAAAANQKADQTTEGGLAGFVSGLIPKFGGSTGKAHGGEIEESDNDGGIDLASLAPAAVMLLNKGGALPDHLKHVAGIYHPSMAVQDLKGGGKVPGKEVVKGDSAKNDTVPAMLSAKEVVLPKSVTQAPDAPAKAAEFLRHLKSGKKNEKGGDYGKVAASKKSLADRVAALEKLCSGGMV